MTPQTAADLLHAALGAATCSPVILAVSGGPDSLALLTAAATLGRAGTEFHVVTVDHGLRDASAAEAAYVAELAARFGLPHRTLRWTGEKLPGNLQANARRARYGLLTDAARALGASAVVTAHHQDDQIETHLLAAARKAGDRGLSGMRSVRGLAPGVRLLRPFLSIPSAFLKALTAAAGLAAIDDPSNRDPRFARIRLREQAVTGDARERLLAAIDRHAARRNALDQRLADWLSSALASGRAAISETGCLTLSRAALFDLDAHERRILFSRAFAAVSGREHPPEQRAVDRIVEASRTGVVRAMTLGGVAVQIAEELRFVREFGRLGLQTVSLSSGQGHVLFDGRFDVALDPGISENHLISAFGHLGRGNVVERTLPVLVTPEGKVRAAHPALARKLGPGVPALSATACLRWRIFADLGQHQLADAGAP